MILSKNWLKTSISPVEERFVNTRYWMLASCLTTIGLFTRHERTLLFYKDTRQEVTYLNSSKRVNETLNLNYPPGPQMKVSYKVLLLLDALLIVL